jgi:dienelactone hydrolase
MAALLGAAPGTPGGLPAGEKDAKAVLEKSPRHGEWIDIAVPDHKTPLKSVFDGAGHGFLRAQDGQNGANQKAAEEAWPETITFLREHTK